MCRNKGQVNKLKSCYYFANGKLNVQLKGEVHELTEVFLSLAEMTKEKGKKGRK